MKMAAILILAAVCIILVCACEDVTKIYDSDVKVIRNADGTVIVVDGKPEGPIQPDNQPNQKLK